MKKSHIPFHVRQAVQPHSKLFKAHFKDNSVRVSVFPCRFEGGKKHPTVFCGLKAAQRGEQPGINPGPMRYRRGRVRSQQGTPPVAGREEALPLKVPLLGGQDVSAQGEQLGPNFP